MDSLILIDRESESGKVRFGPVFRESQTEISALFEDAA
jgi:hypothetical protein